MAHACLIVAVSPDQLSRHGDIESAVWWNMAPFQEDEWYADGTRWDWYVIGGRFTGLFAPPDYSPTDDPRNFRSCSVCDGSGLREDLLGQNERLRNPSFTCNGCNGKGTHRKHPGFWRPVGNVCQRRHVIESALVERQRRYAKESWAEWVAM